MKIIFKSLFLLHCSVSSCFAGTGPELLRDWVSSITTLKKLEKKIEEESNCDQYFAKREVSEQEFRTAKAMFQFSVEGTETPFRAIMVSKKEVFSFQEESTIGLYAFQAYCVSLPLLKNLHDQELRYDPDSPYGKDLKQCIESVGFFFKHFTDLENAMVPFLTVKPSHREPFFQNYVVRFEEKDWLLKQQRQIRSILYRFNQMDLRKLDLPETYETALRSEIGRCRKGLNSGLSSLTPQIREQSLAFKKADKNLALSVDTGDLVEIIKMANNQRTINNTEAISCYPLVFNFVSDSCPEGVSLSAEQQTRSTELLHEMLEEKISLALTQPSVPHYPAGQNFQRKGQLGKKKRRIFAKPQKGMADPTLDNASSSGSIIENTEEAVVIIPSSSEIQEPVLSVREEEHNHDLSLEKISYSVPVVEGSSCETETSTSSSAANSSAASSSCDVETEEDAETKKNISFIDQWLMDIIKKSQSNDKAFTIFQKATRLQLMFAENRNLLQQTQEAVAGLAVRLQMLEIRPASPKIPPRLEHFFTSFMETPISYLKGLRFRVVETFFDTLGIKINKSAEGSRIHFSFGDHKTSIHLHGKELEGGRISSLRKFLIDCGFTYGETQSLPTQKPMRKGRKQ